MRERGVLFVQLLAQKLRILPPQSLLEEMDHA